MLPSVIHQYWFFNFWDIVTFERSWSFLKMYFGSNLKLNFCVLKWNFNYILSYSPFIWHRQIRKPILKRLLKLYILFGSRFHYTFTKGNKKKRKIIVYICLESLLPPVFITVQHNFRHLIRCKLLCTGIPLREGWCCR